MGINVIGRELDQLVPEIQKSPENVLKKLGSFRAFIKPDDKELNEQFGLVKARALMQTGKLNEAKNCLLVIHENNTENPIVFGLLSKIAQREKEFGQAILYSRQNVELSANYIALMILVNALFGYYWQDRKNLSKSDVDDIVSEIQTCFDKMDKYRLDEIQRSKINALKLKLEIISGNLRVVFPRLESEFSSSNNPTFRQYIDLISVSLQIGLVDKVDEYLSLAIKNKVVASNGAWFGLAEELRKAEAFLMARQLFEAIGLHHPAQCLHYALCSISVHKFADAIEVLEKAKKLLDTGTHYKDNLRFKYFSFVMYCFDEMKQDSKNIPPELTAMAREVAREITTVDLSKSDNPTALQNTQKIARKHFGDNA